MDIPIYSHICLCRNVHVCVYMREYRGMSISKFSHFKTSYSRNKNVDMWACVCVCVRICVSIQECPYRNSHVSRVLIPRIGMQM